MKARNLLSAIAGVTALVSFSTAAISAEGVVERSLAYPSGEVTSGDELAAQVWFVNHFLSFDQFGINKKGRKKVTVLVNKSKDKKPTTITVTRFLNNVIEGDEAGIVKAKDLAIFHSGKLKGVGMLITDYVDPAKSQQYAVWLPALRKVRRFGQPGHDDSWGGTDFTFGDVVLRKPHHETHEITGTETFNDCLGFVALKKGEKNRYMKKLPTEGSCKPKGKDVYVLKSTTKYENWWYDYRVSYVDKQSFADYRTEFFKDGQHIKTIDRDWGEAQLDDPRSVTWGYWYGTTLATGHETWAYIPPEVVEYNTGHPQKMWTEKTLRKIKR